MANKIFGTDYTDLTDPVGTETISVNNGTTLRDVTLANVVGQVTHNATTKATPVDADEITLWDSVATTLKKLTWANLKATLNSVYDWSTVTQAATGKTTPVDADEFSIVDSAASNVIKSLTWANVKATLKTYFDTLYSSGATAGADSLRTRYIIQPSVASNNLSVAIKYIDGNDCTSTNKITFRIGDTEYELTAAVSFTKNAGTNWCNSGSTELAAKDVDYFMYAIGETGASAGLKFGFSRIPYAQTMADFVNTTTNEKYIAGNWTNFNATDKVTNIGRFRAQLSATASFNWSIPTSNVVNHQIFMTGILTWQPVYSGAGSLTYTTVTTHKAEYAIRGQQLEFEFEAQGTTGGTTNVTIFATVPFDARNAAYQMAVTAWVLDTGAAGIGAFAYLNSATPDSLAFRRYDSANWGLGANRYINGNGKYTV